MEIAPIYRICKLSLIGLHLGVNLVFLSSLTFLIYCVICCKRDFIDHNELWYIVGCQMHLYILIDANWMIQLSVETSRLLFNNSKHLNRDLILSENSRWYTSLTLSILHFKLSLRWSNFIQFYICRSFIYKVNRQFNYICGNII